MAAVAWLLLWGIVARLSAQDPGPSDGTAPDGADIPHPFFTHMGLPEGVGNFNLRTAGLVLTNREGTQGDFAFHLETGLSRLVGLHIRNDRFLDIPRTEAMFQFAAVMSENGLNGFAPLIEFEIPTRSGVSRINTLVGFTTALGNSRMAVNQVLHYDPREDAVDASVALVVRFRRAIFPVLEVLGEGAKGGPTVVNLLGGVKIRLRDWLIGGIAIQLPLTSVRDFSSEVMFGPDLEWKLRE